MTILLSAIAFFLLITGLILIHELGHFIAARKAGVEVEEFGFGLPPKAVKLFRWKGTDFTLNWIPFGGFVRMKGEGSMEEIESAVKEKGSFAHASILARSIILLAGVTMNFLLALIIFFYGFSWGQWIPTYLSFEEMEQAATEGTIDLQLAVLIEDVLKEGAAQQAGVLSGSVLLSVNDREVTRPDDVVAMQQGAGSVTYRFARLEESGALGEQRTISVPVTDGKTGVQLRMIPLEISAPVRGPGEAFGLALRESRVVMSQTVVGIVQLFSSLAQRGTVPEGVTGIVGIAQLTYSSVQEGFSVYLRLMALLSLSLAALNVLPFPALDGGRLVFVLSELFIRPGNRKIEVIVNSLGFAVLLVLILLVTFYDVLRLFH